MTRNTPHQVDIIELASPAGSIRLWDDLASRRTRPHGGGRITSMAAVVHGRERKVDSWLQLALVARRDMGKPGVSVQLALRNLPEEYPGAGFTTDLEALIVVRHAHEPDIRTAIVERELAESERDHQAELNEAHRVSIMP